MHAGLDEQEKGLKIGLKYVSALFALNIHHVKDKCLLLERNVMGMMQHHAKLHVKSYIHL